MTIDGQRIGLGLVVLALVLGGLGWWWTEPPRRTASIARSAEPEPEPAVAAAPSPVAPAPGASVGPARPKLQVGKVARAAPPVTVVPCQEAVKRYEAVERLAGVINLVKGDLTPYADNYASALLTRPAGDCGLPGLDVERHRKAIQRLRAVGALDAEALAALEDVLGV